MSTRHQTKILHPTHSAWSERKGQWPRVLCATSPWELRLLDHGAPVHCKFEGERRNEFAFYMPGSLSTLRCTIHLKLYLANKIVWNRVCVSAVSFYRQFNYHWFLLFRVYRAYIQLSVQQGMEIDSFNSWWLLSLPKVLWFSLVLSYGVFNQSTFDKFIKFSFLLLEHDLDGRGYRYSKGSISTTIS